MKRAVRGLKLQREVVFVAYNSGQGLAVRRGDRYRALSRIEIPVGIGNRIANIVCRRRAGIAGKIRGDEAALALRHVALRTAGFAKEDGPATLGVAGNLGCCALTLQAAQIADHGLDLGFAERTEGGHAGSRYSSPNNLLEGLVRQALDFTPVRNIGAMFAACPVEPMAGGAGGGKNLFALTRAAGGLAGLLRQQCKRHAHVCCVRHEHQHGESQ